MRIFWRSDFKLLLSLNSLVQAVAPASVRHEPAGEIIDNNNFAVINNILFIQ